MPRLTLSQRTGCGERARRIERCPRIEREFNQNDPDINKAKAIFITHANINRKQTSTTRSRNCRAENLKPKAAIVNIALSGIQFFEDHGKQVAFVQADSAP